MKAQLNCTQYTADEKDGTKLLPMLEYNHFAHHYKNALKFTPLRDDEFARCQTEKICEASMPTFRDHHEVCAISTFYDVQASCNYIPSNSKDPVFITLGTKTFYANPINKTTALTIYCKEDQNRGLFRRKLTLKNRYGAFQLEGRCYASFERR